jgi:hypothetical protein
MSQSQIDPSAALAPPARPKAWRRIRLRIAALVLVVGGIGAFAVWRGHATHAARAAEPTPAPGSALPR